MIRAGTDDSVKRGVGPLSGQQDDRRKRTDETTA